MEGEQDVMQQVSKARVVGGDHDNNPFKKLIAGFCDPFVQHDDDNVTDSGSSSRYSPDLGPQVTSTSTTPATTNGRNGNHHARGVTSANIGTKGTATKSSLDGVKVSTIAATDTPIPPPQEILSRDVSETSLDSITDDVETSNAAGSSDLAVSKTLTSMRRRRGIEVFFISVLFVFSTLLILKELGYAIADFELVVKDSQEFMTGHSKKLIDIVYKSDKSVVLDKIKVKAKAPAPDEESSDEKESQPPSEEDANSAGSTKEKEEQQETPIEATLEEREPDIEEEIQEIVDEEISASLDKRDEF